MAGCIKYINRNYLTVVFDFMLFQTKTFYCTKK